MNLSRRNMLKAGAAALVTAPLTTKADANDFWNQHRRPIPQSMKDGPSSALDASGVVTMPARQVPVYRKCDVLVVGGGDTVAALSACGVKDDITYVSTGGGAFLEFIEGRTLPGIAVLENK